MVKDYYHFGRDGKIILAIWIGSMTVFLLNPITPTAIIAGMATVLGYSFLLGWAGYRWLYKPNANESRQPGLNAATLRSRA